MRKILIIEDEERTRENLSIILEMEGYEVRVASDGCKGLASATGDAPDLILCDVTMPELSGYEVLEAVRKNPELAAIPFVFLTAHGERRDVRTGMNLGADDYLVKPVGASELLACIQARLKRTHHRSPTTPFAPDFDSADPLRSLGLTQRQAEVLLWVAQGKSNSEIGAILKTAENTIKRHLQAIFEKLGVESRHAAALRALEILHQPS